METFLRTVSLVTLTLIFAAIFRFWKPAIHLVQNVAGTSGWQQLYSLFRIDSALGREQLILIGIIVFCFIVALIIQGIILFLLRQLR